MNPEKPKWTVSGFALVPVRVSMTLEADSAAKAIQVAQRKFKAHPSQYVDSNSEDYAAAFDWDPHAEPAPKKIP